MYTNDGGNVANMVLMNSINNNKIEIQNPI